MSKKLLGVTNIGGRLERDWMYYGDGGKRMFATEVVQDVEPVFDYVKRERKKDPDQRYAATIPSTVIEDLAKINAQQWGIRKQDAFREIMAGKTDRAQKVMRELLYGRDYRKFQNGD